jgi:hypothetical protein
MVIIILRHSSLLNGQLILIPNLATSAVALTNSATSAEIAKYNSTCADGNRRIL